jgi:hypothetical protein
MSTPNFSPISTFRKAAPNRKSQQLAIESSNRPKYQCPGCQELFAKWSPCLSHLREQKHVDADLLDKKTNGGDFRRVQELCANLAYHHRGGGSGTGSRERTDSMSSTDSLSSDSGGEEEEPNVANHPAMNSASNSRRYVLKQKFTPTSSSLNAASSRASNVRMKAISSRGLDLRRLEEKVMFRILTFLDVDCSRMLFLAMTVIPSSAPVESRVRMWSMSSDPDSSSLPSASPPSSSRKTFHQTYSNADKLEKG